MTQTLLIKNNTVTLAEASLQIDFNKAFPAFIIYLATIIILLSFFKDLVRVGFKLHWLLIRIGYLPFILIVWEISKRKFKTRFYEIPLWAAGLYITSFCTYFSFSTGGLKSDYIFGLLQLYFAIALMPITAITFYVTTFFSIAIYVGVNLHEFGLPSACWQRICIAFINAMAGGVCFFLSLYFVEVMHIDITMAGLIISSYGVGMAIGGIMGGKLSDKISPSIVSISCLFIQAVAFLALIKLNTVPLLMAAEFILGLASYAFITSNKVWVLNNCKDHENIKLKTLSMLYAGSNLGIGMSAVMVSLLSHYGFPFIFFLSSSFLLLAAVMLVFQERKQVILENEDEKISIETALPKVDAESNSNKKTLWLILICLFSIGLIIAQLSTTYSIYIIEAFPKLGLNAVSIVFILNSFLIVFFQTPIVNYFNNYNKILMVGIGAFLMGCGMSILSFAFVFPIAIFSVVVYTMGEMIFFSMAQLVVYQQGSEKKKGQSLGLFQSTYALSVIVGPTLGGYVYDSLGGNMLWYLSGLIGLSCLMACSVYKKYNIKV